MNYMRTMCTALAIAQIWAIGADKTYEKVIAYIFAILAWVLCVWVIPWD